MLYDASGREIPEPVRRKRYGYIPSDPSPEAIQIEPEADPADAIASHPAETETHEAMEKCRHRT